VVDGRAVRERLARLSDGRLEDLDTAAADVLNYAGSHRGYAAQRELWFNPPLVIAYGEKDVRLSNVNERIVEVPFALRALGDVPVGSRVLDFGSSESWVALSLASMGYQVTALDLREYPFSHPNLTSVASPIETWSVQPDSYDAVLCISTLEHVGLGWYGDPDDAEAGDVALRRLSELLRAGGLLVLTVPYGTAEVTDVQRRYDRAQLDALLAGWEVLERVIVEQRDDVTWQPVPQSTKNAVALVVARNPSTT
jgi:2-polyprenyl-3-methyl-5-hydroxy-6-metoxy-1,4-benzoquinol methylase